MNRLLVLTLLALPLLADKSTIALLTDVHATGPGTLIVSSATDEERAVYSFQLSRLDGTAVVSIEQTTSGGGWHSVGQMTRPGDIVRASASGGGAFRAKVVACAVDPANALSVYMRTCVVSVVGTLSGASAVVAVTPTAVPTATVTPTRTPTP